MYHIVPINPDFIAMPSLLIIGEIEAILAKVYVGDSKKISLSNQGSLACRLLLQQLFFANARQFSQSFEVKKFPYSLDLSNSLANTHPQITTFIYQLYQHCSAQSASCQVSFSHSRKHIAILLSVSGHLGVDIEDKIVSEAVSSRYFLSNENDWVITLPSHQQPMARKLLWTLKESLIKAQNSQDSQLIAGLKLNLHDYLSTEQMTNLLSQSQHPKFNHISFHDNQHMHIFGFSPYYQCGFYLQ